MKATILLLLALLGILPLAAQSTEQLSSPDGKYVFSFNPHDGRLSYSLLYKGKTVVSDGDLGINIDNHLIEKAMGIPQDTARLWSSSMRLIKVDRSTADTTWEPLYGEHQDDPKLSTRTKVSTTQRTIKSGERITLPLLKSGGAAIEFKKVK